MILATCATIAAILSSASGGEIIQLTGTCPTVKVTKLYKSRVTVQADKATVKGLSVTGGNITWQGGVIQAAAGAFSTGPDGYAINLRGAASVNIENVRVTDARKGLVMDGAKSVIILNNTFDRVGEDGIIASASSTVNIVNNRFENTVGKPTVCSFLVGLTSGLSSRDCISRGGKWLDGFHPDAVQMRNGMSQVIVANNTITGATQGITQMDTTGDKPLSHVFVRNNITKTSTYHPLTLGNCIDCEITGNSVTRAAGSTVKTQIIPGAAMACDNSVQDVKTGTAACKKK